MVLWQAVKDGEKCGGGKEIKRGGEIVKEKVMWEYNLYGNALMGRTEGMCMLKASVSLVL